MSIRLALLLCTIMVMACGKPSHTKTPVDQNLPTCPNEAPTVSSECPYVGLHCIYCSNTFPIQQVTADCIANAGQKGWSLSFLTSSKCPSWPGCPSFDAATTCSAEEEGYACQVDQVSLECSAGEWIVLAPTNGLPITASTEQTPTCPVEDAVFDTIYLCSQLLETPGDECCAGNKAVVRLEVTGQLVSNVEVVSFFFPCGYRALSTWVDPFLSCLAGPLAQMQISCDPAVPDLKLEFEDGYKCME
jgi:hypothetical protein